jgi:uncharacterized protein YbgA (DUF1722 family)/uncharacterized protein YbbK (DUF523 family)
MTQINQERPKLGISSCLLGENVRFNGGHKHNGYVTKTLSAYFEFVSFCPEVAIGLPVPRKPIRLVSKAKSPVIKAVDSHDPSIDYSAGLDNYARTVVGTIDDFCGYIVKKDSPSCGMERVKVYERDDAPPNKRGVGLFTSRLIQEMPELPIEEEGRLMDPGLRENFITRVFTMSRWRALITAGLTKQSLLEFHTRHKFLILAHDEVTYRELGKILSNLREPGLDLIADEYLKLLMQGLRHPASPGKHANVLMHIMGFIKDRMSAAEKEELLDLIEAHRLELVPIIVPITLLNHFLRVYPHDYIDKQYYLEPNPRELMLRNSI